MTTITIGCKLPAGLIIKSGNTSVTLNGANASRIVGGYGLTHVDKDFFDAWRAEYANYSPLKNGLIFAQDSSNKAQGQATEQAEVKSGFEAIDPTKGVAGAKPEGYEGKAAA